jgi:hypothetical protein
VNQVVVAIAVENDKPQIFVREKNKYVGELLKYLKV